MFAKKRTLTIVVAMALAASMLLSSCTKVDNAAKSKYPGTSEKGTAVINLGAEPPKMFSVISTDTASGVVLLHLMDGLTVLDKEDKPQPGVAKKWKVSDDGKVYTFELRDDYKWTNGEKVTANDFKFAFLSLLDPKFASEYAYFGYVFKNGEKFSKGEAKAEDVGVKVIDDYKLELTLENPTPYLPGMLAYKVFLPVNKKAYDTYGEKYATDAKNIVTNGAYKLEKWEHENEIVITKNADYPDAKKVKIDKIVMKMIKDSNAAMNSFKGNEIDMIGLNGDQLAMLNKEGQPTYSYDDNSNWYFEFNMKRPVLANAKVRQALTTAIDSESFVKNVLKNSSKPARQFTPPAIAGYKKSFYEEIGPQFKSNDIEGAKKLIEEAKKELGMDKISFTLIVDDTDTASKHAAFFQETWKKLGVDVKIQAVPFKSRLEKMTQKDFDVTMAGWGPDYNDPMTFLDLFETGNGNNHTSYTNKAYDELLAKVRKETDKKARFGYLAELEKILMKDMPIGPYYFRARDYTVSGKLSGVVRTGFQDINLKWAEVK
ncbi:peptide ABC transporter substrate-binding protein [Paludicola sp. MB14-C6]|uniref:peptide ABC transporter substrate-binding protein n=1 Tax=Paludihabitans sp. MB14-C6 TaxID=3070656 RepID=UPI0027DE8AB8|nr:peptide ABC transporter substrate-binding protein [Paludicola sp. MB14-C6]WMJ22310.1 peptide ABC transporter substrate-binding protein [Paludicola sp. MB14-C6]